MVHNPAIKQNLGPFILVFYVKMRERLCQPHGSASQSWGYVSPNYYTVQSGPTMWNSDTLWVEVAVVMSLFAVGNISLATLSSTALPGVGSSTRSRPRRHPWHLR
jgi:hypothetical protein